MNDITPYHDTARPHDDVGAKELLYQLWRAKWWMTVFMVLCTAGALVYYVVATPLYKITMIIAPAETTETRFGGGSMRGDNGMGQNYKMISNGGTPITFDNFTNIVTGPSVATVLMQDATILKMLNQYRKNDIGSAEELSDFLTQKISVTPVGETPLKRLSFYHADPDFGVALLRKIHLVADHIIQKEDNAKAEKRIDYLRKNLREILNPDHRKALADLLMQQEHIFMLTNLDDAYAARVIEPPSHSARTAWPSLPLLITFGVFAGLFVGYLVSWFRSTGIISDKKTDEE